MSAIPFTTIAAARARAGGKPILLDEFCGAGGAARGYQLAGFYVVGVDNRPQPRYAGDEFIQADAMTFPLEGFDAIHASPPCQAYSIANNVHKLIHPKLLESTLARLRGQSGPYVVENVESKAVWRAMQNPLRLCGLTLGLNVKRHRLFETSVAMLAPPCPKGHPGNWLLVFGHTVMDRGHVVRQTPAGFNTTARKHVGTDKGREAMGIDWMNRDELSEAIPPAYTEYVGRALLAQMKVVG